MSDISDKKGKKNKNKYKCHYHSKNKKLKKKAMKHLINANKSNKHTPIIVLGSNI
jgi:hypothetical protein